MIDFLTKPISSFTFLDWFWGVIFPFSLIYGLCLLYKKWNRCNDK